MRWRPLGAQGSAAYTYFENEKIKEDQEEFSNS